MTCSVTVRSARLPLCPDIGSLCVCAHREKDASIPLIPGYDGTDQSTDTLSSEAKRIGTY
jgi:acetyl/propionyl-CoA carboxylase alpha subunit